MSTLYDYKWCHFSSVQSLSRAWLFVTPCTAACQASLSITNSRSLHKLISVESVMCHATISSCVIPISSCPQSFPASRSFQISQLFASGGQSTGVSASPSVPPMNTQDQSPLGWTGWISLQSKWLSKVFSRLGVLNSFSTYWSFQLTMGLSGWNSTGSWGRYIQEYTNLEDF